MTRMGEAVRLPAIRSIACVVLLALAGCSSSKPIAKPSGPDASRDRSNGRAILLTRFDFPKGWKALPKDKSQGPFTRTEQQKFDACLGTKIASADRTEVEGTSFGNGPAQAGSSISFAATPEEAAADLVAFGNALRRSCFTKILRSVFQEGFAREAHGVRVTSLTLTRVKQARLGDAIAAFRLALGLTIQGHAVKVVEDLVLIRAKRAEITVEFTNVGAPFNGPLQRQLLRRLGRRLDLA